MQGRFSRIVGWVFALAIVLSSQAALADIARISGVRFGGESNITRVVIDANTQLNYEYFTLADGAMRVVVDMPRVRWSIDGLTSESGSGAGQGVVRQYRFGHNSPTTSRLVLDLDGPADVVKAFRLKPKSEEPSYRLVLDLERVSASVFQANAGTVEERRKRREKRKIRKPLIVVDAGHGGKDPGALGVHGHKEKDITLAAALALTDALRRTGRYEVALTRGTDVFIELEERVNRAREFQADLFISLHADAGSKAETRGATVYTLSPSGEKRAKKMRETQNWTLEIEDDAARSPYVNAILVDLVEAETKNRSAQFAETLIPQIKAAGWPALRRTHRDAGFFVLLAPDVPAVLLEMGFMTNPDDERLLTSERHRRKLVSAIVRSIDSFFSGQELYVAQR